MTPGQLIALLRDPDGVAFRLWYLPRRVRLLATIKVLAAWNRSTVDVRLAPDLMLGRQLRVTVGRRTHTIVRIGSRGFLGDRVWLQLSGGELHVGDDVRIRRDCVVSVGGRVDLVGGNTLGYGVILHCAERVFLDRFAGVAEYCGIADSTHFHVDPSRPGWAPFHHNVTTSPVHIGREVFLGPRASVSRGVTIGDLVIVGPGSTVAKDVPAGVLVSGIPARVVRDLGYGWLAAQPAPAPELPHPVGPPAVGQQSPASPADRIESRATPLPEEAAAGDGNDHDRAEAVLEESDERTAHPTAVEHRTSADTVPPPGTTG